MTKISNQDYIQELEAELDSMRKIKYAFETYVDAIEDTFGLSSEWNSDPWLKQYRDAYIESNTQYYTKYGR